MEKLTQEQINNINRNMIVNETEKAIQLKVNYTNSFTGNEKEIYIWVPKTCVELSGCGILVIKQWFRKNKESELHGIIEPVLNY